VSLAEFGDQTIDDLTARLVPLGQVLTGYPTLRVDAETESAIARGKVFSCGPAEPQPEFAENAWHRVLSSEGLLIALAKPVVVHAASDPQSSGVILWHPSVVLIARN
jgi:hypothetical protein